MQVSIVEPWHHEMAIQIDHLRLVAFELLQIGNLAHRQNAIAADRDGFCANDRIKGTLGRDARVHVGVHEDDVGLLRG